MLINYNFLKTIINFDKITSAILTFLVYFFCCWTFILKIKLIMIAVRQLRLCSLFLKRTPLSAFFFFFNFLFFHSFHNFVLFMENYFFLSNLRCTLFWSTLYFLFNHTFYQNMRTRKYLLCKSHFILKYISSYECREGRPEIWFN